MGKKIFMMMAAVLGMLLLAGCKGGEAPEAPTPDVSDPAPVQTEEISELPLTPAPKLTLADFIVDDTHDAFPVDTGGSLGRLWVMVEKDEGSLQFSVWSTDDWTEPLQTFAAEGQIHFRETADANFDGYQDFGYAHSLSASNVYYRFWLWDEERGLFVEAPELADVCSPQFDAETEIISSDTYDSAMSGSTSLYRWENGELVCIRQIDLLYPTADSEQEAELAVSDRINGTLAEVYRITSDLMLDGDWIFKEAEQWRDLDYQGP